MLHKAPTTFTHARDPAQTLLRNQICDYHAPPEKSAPQSKPHLLRAQSADISAESPFRLGPLIVL